MKLIADSGSTKTDWVLLKDGEIFKRIHTEGYNPYYINSNDIYNSIQDNLIPELSEFNITEIYFYGAGCSTAEKKEVLFTSFEKSFANANIFIDHDLMAAARSLLNKEKGFAAILGTGTNTCLFDGYQIIYNIDSLGHHLGDEGSGSYIGKKLIRDYMRNTMPSDIYDKFKIKYNYSNKDIYDTLFTTSFPNRFLASFSDFAGENIKNHYIHHLVFESFKDFFNQLVSKYPDYQSLKFNSVGSVGFYFKDILSEVASEFNMEIGTIIKSPMDGLLKYHHD